MDRRAMFKLGFTLLSAFSLLAFPSQLFAEKIKESCISNFQKLDVIYTVSYGSPNAPIHITEYFSFSCPKCLEFIRRDFLAIQEAYIDTGNIYWTFHPDPADILTLQAMVCFEQLENPEKQELLEFLAHEIRSFLMKKACFKLQEKMADLGKPVPSLHELSFLEKTAAFAAAYAYLKQDNVPAELPTIEINGKVHQEFPSREWVDQILIDLQNLTNRRFG